MYELRDYNIWKEGDSYMVKVKDTGETTPVSQEIVRVLWSTEDYERYLVKKDIKNGLTSFDVVDEDGCSLAETLPLGGERDVEEIFIWKAMKSQCEELFTDIQKRVFRLHFIQNLSVRETADKLGISFSSAYETREYILIKLTKSSYFTPDQN